MQKLNRNKIQTPTLQVTDEALMQFLLMQQQNQELTNQKTSFIRLDIKGKGCDGFEYRLFQDKLRDDDFTLSFTLSKNIIKNFLDNLQSYEVQILMTPFCAFYFQNGKIDYVIDEDTNTDGFLIENFDQDSFKKKFWVKDESKVPPTQLS